jgi:hypothetical protein
MKKITIKFIVIGLIGIIFLASIPIVISNKNMISNENLNEKTTDNDDIKVRIFGFKRFFVWVRNNRDEQITVYVNYSMQFGELGANSTINPFPVKAKSATFIFWDCQPMPMYYTKIRVEAGGQNFTKNGFTFLGFNFFSR